MIPRLALVLVASLALPAPASAGPGGDAEAILRAAAERYRALDGLCARFVQHLRVPLTGDERTSRGRICQRPPDRFLMRFTEPAGDVVVADGEYVWIHYPSTDPKQVLRRPMGEGGARFDFYRRFVLAPTESHAVSYAGAVEVDGRPAHAVTLEPRGPAAYASVRLWIDREDSLVRRVRITEENGTTRTLDLRELELDPELPEGTFEFEPPPGATVITR